MERLLSRPPDSGEWQPGQHGLLGGRKTRSLVGGEGGGIVTPSPDAGEGDLAPPEDLDRLRHETVRDPLAAPLGTNVELGDLGLEAGAGVEEDDPAESDRSPTGIAGDEDVVVAGEVRGRA